MHPEIVNLALSRIKADRDKVAPGEYVGCATLRVHFGLKVGEDFEARIAAAVPWMKLFGVALSKLNDTTVESIVREALDAEIDEAELKERAQRAVDALVEKTRRPVKGRVTGACAVTEILALDPEEE